MIELRDITRSYKMGENVVTALKSITLTIEDGDFVAVMGPSGSGKSTLTHILGLLDVPSSGSYRLHGREVSKLSEDDLAVLRRDEIGFIFQQFNLLPRMDATDNVALPLLYSRKSNGVERARKLLDMVGLLPRADHRPNELSGGQQQRVAIARSLVNQPRIIFADEPTGNLDSNSEKEIMAALRDLNSQGITVIIVTHEDEIGQQANRLIRLRDGVIQSDQRLRPLPTQALKKVEPEGHDIPSFWREIGEYFLQGLKTLGANKVRTALSMLGILIGVAAVVAMLALGAGAQKAIEAQLSSLGSNLLVIRAGARRVGGVAQESGSTARLELDDGPAMATAIPAIKAVGPTVNGRAQAVYLGKNWNTQLMGTAPAYAEMRASVPTSGRFFTDEENRSRARVAVIGATVVREIFGEQNPIGEMIKINRVNFQVVGVLPEKGAQGWRDQDDVILIPVTTAMYRLLGKLFVDSIDVEVREGFDVNAVQDELIEVMNKRHRVPPALEDSSFQVSNMAEIQAALAQSSNTMAALLASIAAISLLVGGIGIMNIMLVSVTERTKEIGLRKAIGAKRRDILMQFLAESVVVSVVGGVIGIILGWLITVVLSSVSGWATSVSIASVLLAFFFSAFVGVVFGIYPATKASKLHPIDALRFE